MTILFLSLCVCCIRFVLIFFLSVISFAAYITSIRSTDIRALSPPNEKGEAFRICVCFILHFTQSTSSLTPPPSLTPTTKPTRRPTSKVCYVRLRHGCPEVQQGKKLCHSNVISLILLCPMLNKCSRPSPQLRHLHNDQLLGNHRVNRVDRLLSGPRSVQQPGHRRSGRQDDPHDCRLGDPLGTQPLCQPTNQPTRQVIMFIIVCETVFSSLHL